MHHDFDVVIVGGRIAGGTLATELGKLGVKVCVLERDDLQAEPTSTHVIYANTVDRLINQIGVDRDQLMSSGAPRLTSLDMVLQNSISCSFPLRGSYCIRRSVVDNALLDTARRAGAEIRLNARVTGLLDDGQRITGVKLDDGTEIRARFVVGADGLASTVAREVKAEPWLDIPSDRFCYFSYFHCPEGLRHDLAQFGFGDTPDKCGYIIFGTGNGQMLIGVFPANSELEAFKADPEGQFMARLAAYPPIAPYLAGGQADRLFMRIKMPSFMRRSVGPGWALVGDAGHFKDFVLSQGMCDASNHALKLAPVIRQLLDDPSCEQTILDAWERERDLESIDVLFLSVQLSRAEGMGALATQLMDDAMNDPATRPLLGGIYERAHRPADLFNLKNMLRAAVGAVQNQRGSLDEVVGELEAGFAGQMALGNAVEQIKNRPVRSWALAKNAA
jgi:flavin-dependent dehydrogenase